MELIRVGWRGGFSSHSYPDVSVMVGICPIVGLFIFTRCVSNTLDFRKNIEDSDPLLGFPIRIFFCATFSYEAPKLSVNTLSISAQASEVSSARSSRLSLILSPGC